MFWWMSVILIIQYSVMTIKYVCILISYYVLCTWSLTCTIQMTILYCHFSEKLNAVLIVKMHWHILILSTMLVLYTKSKYVYVLSNKKKNAFQSVFVIESFKIIQIVEQILMTNYEKQITKYATKCNCRNFNESPKQTRN